MSNHLFYSTQSQALKCIIFLAIVHLIIPLLNSTAMNYHFLPFKDGFEAAEFLL